MANETVLITADVRATIVGQIVAGYVSRNEVSVEELPNVVSSINEATNILFEAPKLEAEVPFSPFLNDVDMGDPEAIVAATVFDDGIVSLLDGKRHKTMKRHLTTNGTTPEAYIERFNLPANYPMVCSDYSAKRSQLAKDSGLGRKAGKSTTTTGATSSDEDGDAGSSESDSRRSWNGLTPPNGVTTVEDTIHTNHLICLEDGEEVKALSRYLKSRHQITFAEYKDKWNLPDDYPSVPPALSKARAETQRKRWAKQKGDAKAA